MAGRRNRGSNVDFLEALKALCVEREISPEFMFDAIETALVAAYKRNFDTAQNVEVNIDRDNGTYHVYAIKDVVEKASDEVTEISLEEADKIDPKYEIGDKVLIEVTPKNFGRIAAQAAKQVVVQKIREAERGMLYEEFSGKENDIVVGTVDRIENNDIIIDIGKTEAVLLATEQVPGEKYNVGDRIKAYIVEVKKGAKGAQVFVSRTHSGLLRRLFELEIPEIQEGIIEIKSVIREAGSRSKVAVYSKDENIDPVGSCIGQKGVRVKPIFEEIGNEKVDIVRWSADPVEYISNALSPAKVKSVEINAEDKIAHVVVPNNQLSLAIGKVGQNARLAAKLTNWKIDIKSIGQVKAESKQKAKPEPAKAV